MVYQNREATAFWQQMKLMCDPKNFNDYKHIRIIVFAAYGDRPGSGTDFSTPFAFPASYGVQLLFCTAKEADELMDEFNDKNEAKIRISAEMKKHLYRITEGHIGLLLRTLEGIEEKFKNTAKYREVNDGEISHYLLSADFLSLLKTFRAAPILDDLNEKEKAIIDSLLLRDVIPLEENEEMRSAALTLMKKGIIRYSDKGKEKDYATSANKICFISLLIRQICFHRLHASPSSITEPSTLEEFLLQCLNRMKPSYLKRCLGVGQDAKLLERSWQMEFYRIATSLLPSNCFISPDVGHIFGTTGMADFYINDRKKWIIELIREGDRLGDHSKKFRPGGNAFFF